MPEYRYILSLKRKFSICICTEWVRGNRIFRADYGIFNSGEMIGCRGIKEFFDGQRHCIDFSRGGWCGRNWVEDKGDSLFGIKGGCPLSLQSQYLLNN